MLLLVLAQHRLNILVHLLGMHIIHGNTKVHNKSFCFYGC